MILVVPTICMRQIDGKRRDRLASGLHPEQMNLFHKTVSDRLRISRCAWRRKLGINIKEYPTYDEIAHTVCFPRGSPPKSG